MTTEQPRMTADERRERILEAAAAVFGRRGYDGATTDQVARSAGISQPYVVRLFGSKEALFLAVVEWAHTTLLTEFRDVLASPSDGTPVAGRLGDRYVELAERRGVHLTLMQCFMQGADPVLGAAARRAYLDIWRMLREEAGLDGVAARDFLAQGMLISVLLALEVPQVAGEDPEAAELLELACGSRAGELVAAVTR